VTAAALDIREHPQTNVYDIIDLGVPEPPFLPTWTNLPQDFKLPIFVIPGVPIFSVAAGTYPGTQTVYLHDVDPKALIYYTTNGQTPQVYSTLYGAPITVSSSETIQAIAVDGDQTLYSDVGSAGYVISGMPINPSGASVQALVSADGSTKAVSVTAYSFAKGTVVTFGTAGPVGGSFSPASCTITANNCTVSYLPTGTLAAGVYVNDLTASFSAADGYAATTASTALSISANSSQTTLYGIDGQYAQPAGTLVQAPDGYFYGDTNLAPDIFKVDLSGNFTSVYPFTGGASGQDPQGTLVLGTDGLVYGTTTNDGATGDGTVFKVDTSGTYTLLYTFTGSEDGAQPYGGLVQGTDGNFYGTTILAGTYNGGTMFKIDSSGNFTVLHSFNPSSEGYSPNGNLVQGTDGDFYGLNQGGGTDSLGTVFKANASGDMTTLYNFTGLADGSNPVSGLIQGTDGNFYGQTEQGGSGGVGVIFKMSATGSFTPLYSLQAYQDGGYPQGKLVEGSDGHFYGLGAFDGNGEAGTMFSIDSSGNFTVLYSFDGGADGGYLYGSLVQGSDGAFYGTGSGGGPADTGVIFRLATVPALAGPVTLTVPASVTHGLSFVLSYTVANASSKTMQQCFATNTGGDTSGWRGVKTAATTATNATLTAPATAGSYTYSLTCGGMESGFATLTVK
jgi:uncharacterized repeat protein (TIGR03803 family)